MSIEHIDAGRLDERVDILKLEKAENEYRWETARRSRARVELQQKKNNFSTHGIGAAGAELVIHRQEEPMAVNAMRYVLVVHPEIVLNPGQLVEVDGEPWPIILAHRLDPCKAEYELEREVEL